MYIILAILAFGVLVFVHELGHFLIAKACKVKVNEFSMGMGPRLLKIQGKETEYSLRLLPLGGYCAMEGEEEDSADPRSFSQQNVGKKLLIMGAGAAMNFLLGFILISLLYCRASGFNSPVIVDFVEGCPYEGTLQVGDELYKVNGHRIYFTGNFPEYAIPDENGNIDLVIRRDGTRMALMDFPMVPVEFTEPDGSVSMKYGLFFGIEKATVFTTIRYSWYTSLDFVRVTWQSLKQLISGQVSVKNMSGVVGIVDTINVVGQSSGSAAEGLENIIYLVALIAVNLAVTNLLPIPALDGGHMLTLLISWLIEKITGHKPDARIEGYIHYIGLILLLAFMMFIMFNDVMRIIQR